MKIAELPFVEIPSVLTLEYNPDVVASLKNNDGAAAVPFGNWTLPLNDPPFCDTALLIDDTKNDSISIKSPVVAPNANTTVTPFVAVKSSEPNLIPF